MQVVLCALAKKEHLYIKDWVNWYLKLGFDKIYIYDNDDIDSPNIKDYLPNSDKIEIIDIRGVSKPKLQHDIYTDFYKTHNFDWCLFCDIDEFLVGVGNIHNFLSQSKFNGTCQIRIRWKLFGDDDLIERDMSKPVYEIFSHEIKKSLNRNLIDLGNLEIQGKAIVRGGIKNVVVRSPHFASLFEYDKVLPSVLPSGIYCKSKVAIYENYSNESVFLNHYMTKSLSEFVKQKLDRNDAVYNKNIKLDYYWRINKKTPQKIEWLKEKGLL